MKSRTYRHVAIQRIANAKTGSQKLVEGGFSGIRSAPVSEAALARGSLLPTGRPQLPGEAGVAGLPNQRFLAFVE
jgi:hypothetical protein